MNALWLLTFFGTMALSLWAAARVKIAYAKGSQVPASSGFTGAEAAARILDAAGIRDVEIVEQDGLLGDHYDPMHRRLVLSSENFHGHSAAALGVAAHECGHAIQHKIAYAPLQWRMASVGATTFASQIVTWLPLLGFFSGFGGFHSQTYLMIMVAGWGVPKMKFIAPGTELTTVEKVLRAAAWTYVAAFITSLLYLLWHLLPLLSGRRND
ncbi:MAG: zinc metallopeptidase [Verrucomicrobia bacterium]|nr:zinc metallopeptidase [Verrucomicrobiota bacterium]